MKRERTVAFVGEHDAVAAAFVFAFAAQCFDVAPDQLYKFFVHKNLLPRIFLIAHYIIVYQIFFYYSSDKDTFFVNIICSCSRNGKITK